MQIDIDDAEALAVTSLQALGYSADEARTIADHLLDCELRGLGFSGLARVVSIAERLDGAPPAAPDAGGITRETGVSAQLDGGDRIGYLVGLEATELAIDKATGSGIGIVGASRTWYTGMLSYYAERITARGLVAMIASNATPWVAPAGGTQARFGTNPFCFGFPASETPLIWDIGISEIIHAQALLAHREGREIPEGVAYDADGAPTTDPLAALSGALVAWGGHKGSGLGVSVQLLGALAGSAVAPPQLADFGMLVLAIDPQLLGEREAFIAKVDEYRDLLRDTRPLDADRPVRVPFERSARDRARRMDGGVIDVPDVVLESVRALVGP